MGREPGHPRGDRARRWRPATSSSPTCSSSRSMSARSCPTCRPAATAATRIVGCMAASEVVTLTRLGGLDMAKPATGAMALIKRLRGARTPAAASGKSQMAMLRRLPRILRFLPGKAQDLRAWFLTMQYWLGGSDDNVEAMVRFLVSRYAGRSDWRGAAVAAPVEYPEVGLYHPRLAARIATRVADLPAPAEPKATVGLLVMRAYVLSGDTAHYDAVIAALEARDLRVIPAFASGPRFAPGDRGLFPRCAGRGRRRPRLAHRLQPRRRPRLQRQRRRRGHPGRPRRALRRRAPARVPDPRPVGGERRRPRAGRGDDAGGAAGDRRRHQPDRLRRAARRRRLPGLRPPMRRQRDRAGRWRPATSASRCSPPGSRGWPRCAAAARPSAGSAS